MIKGISTLKIIGSIAFLFAVNTLFAQEVIHKHSAKASKQTDEEILKEFDEAAAIADLKERGISEKEFAPVIAHEKIEFVNKKRGKIEKPVVPYFSLQKTPVGPCDNSGFESGDFTNWTGATGLCDLMPATPTTWTPGLVPTRQTIMTGAGFDPHAINTVTGLPEIPVVAPGGLTYSVRLGNDQIGAETEYLRYPINVTASNTSFTYQYAVVLQWVAIHTAVQQPRFDITVFDASGAPVSGPCGAYSIEAIAAAADSTFSPFNIDPVSGAPEGYYKKWTTVSIDLTPYIGTTVNIQFQSSDCTQTGHFGYAYIDCSCSQLAASVAFCPNDTLLLLTAPAGFNSYQWYDNTGAIIAGATSDTLTIQNPVLGQVYSVSMLSASGCGTSLTVTLAYSDILVNTNIVPVTCFGNNDGYAYAAASGAIPPFTYSWEDSSGSVISPNDSLLNAVAGTYYITVSSLGGCSRRDTITIPQPPLPSDTTGVKTTFCPGDPKITLVAPTGYTSYEWHEGTANTPIIGSDDSLLVYTPTAGILYTVVMQPPVTPPATYSCPVFLTTTLDYSPPPMLPDYIVKSNVFTPDGDGKNETFDLNQFAYVKEFHIEIYNRWGKKVFESDDLTSQWNGKINGKDAAEGVYYWMATYKSTCTVDPKSIENKGFVHLLRN